ncbi:MAG: hypothetical protein MI796_08975, partial [Enterobacterales bacterium]|nr:hypothetical protein [Enterobacterales bacterium]
MHSANSKPSIFRFTLIGLLSFLILSCATMDKNDRNYTTGGQPGDILYNYVTANTNNSSTVSVLLANYKGPKRLAPIVEKYEEEIATLYNQQVLSPAPSTSEDEKKA